MAVNPAIRASDDDRRRVVTALERHAADGRLRLDEFDERTTAALRAVTLGDLAALTRDLPADPEYAADPTGAGPARSTGPSAVGPDAGARSLVLAFALATLTLVVLGVILAVAR